MNQTKQVPAIIKILSIIALACAGLTVFIDMLLPVLGYSLSIRFLFNITMFIAPIVLLFLYVLKLGGKDKPTILLVIALGIISFNSLYNLIDYASTMEILFGLPLSALCAVAIIFTFVKGEAKLFGIITAGVGLLYCFISFVLSLEFFDVLFFFESLAASSATALQYVVLLLLSLNGFLSNAKESAPVQPEAQPFYAPQPQAPVYAQPEVQPTYAPQPQAPVYAQPEAQPVAPVEPVAAQPVEVKPETPAE